MLCQESKCLDPAVFVCRLCKKSKALCINHGIPHSKNLKHKIESISVEDEPLLILNSIKSKIKDCIAEILNESNIVIAQINEASKFAIVNLKELNKNVSRILTFKVVLFEQSTINNLREQATKLLNEMKKPGAIYLAFNALSLEEKKEYARLNWKMINVNDFELLLLSENRKYLFACTFYIGIR